MRPIPARGQPCRWPPCAGASAVAPRGPGAPDNDVVVSRPGSDYLDTRIPATVSPTTSFLEVPVRARFWPLLLLAACGAPDSDPVRAAERFHERRIAGDDAAVHALLTAPDQAVVPMDVFPGALPPRLARKVAGAGRGPLDSASLLRGDGDTATVVLHLAGEPPDTLRLHAAREPGRLWRLERERVHWRVALGVAEQARLDSLAAAVRSRDGAVDEDAVEKARAYLAAAERHPGMARSADLDAARSTLRRAEGVAALRIDLRVVDTFTGSRFIEGRVANPAGTPISTLTLVVRDAAGAEEPVEVWNLAAGGTTSVRQITRLRPGPLTHRFDRIQVF
jgi:hypothetical protein